MALSFTVCMPLYTLVYHLTCLNFSFLRKGKATGFKVEHRCQCSRPVSIQKSHVKKSHHLIQYCLNREKKKQNNNFSSHDSEIRNRETRTRFCVRVCFLRMYKMDKLKKNG